MSRALVCLTALAVLIARPAAAALYAYETRQHLVSIRLTSMAAPVIGQNMSGEFLALSMQPEKRDGYDVVRSRCAAARAGREITVELLFTTLYGAGRLEGTATARRLSLTALASDGTSHQIVFQSMSEGQWNTRVSRFKSVCCLGRLAYEYTWWSDEAKKTAERLQRLKSILPEYAAAVKTAGKALQSAQDDHRSAVRRHAAAAELARAAAALGEACHHCSDMKLVKSARELNHAAGQVLKEVSVGISRREEETTALERIAAVRQRVEEKTRVAAATSGEPTNEVEYAANEVRWAADQVEYAANEVGWTADRVEYAVNEAQRNADEATQARVRLQADISEAKARIAQAKREMAAIDAQGRSLSRRLGLWPPHRSGRRVRPGQ